MPALPSSPLSDGTDSEYDESPSDESTCLSTPSSTRSEDPKSKVSTQNRKRGRSDDHAKKKPKKRTKHEHRDSDCDPKKGLTPREQCLHVARWIPRGIDLFCKLTDVFRIAPLIEQEEATNIDHSEDQEKKNDRDRILQNVPKDVQARVVRSYKKITTLAPYLQVLADGNSKKRQELEGLLAEMQVIIGQVRSEDASHLKPVIGQYAAPEPDIKSLEPPIFADTQRSRAKMGIDHPQLAAMLCPVKYLGEYKKDPQGTRQKLQNGDIKMRAAVWPAFVYSGKIAGENFNPKQVQDGLLDGYLVERVMKHLFLGPSSALGAEGESVGTRPCNARLHNMTEVEAENIAYGVIQSRFAIASRDKWNEVDGNYNYRDAYYRIIDTIRCAPDASWAKKLHETWNLKLFKNKLGLHASSSMATADDDEEDDMALMKKQYEQRLANEATVTVATPPSAVHTEELPTPPKSPSYDDHPPVPDNIAPSAGGSEPHPPDENITPPPNSDPEPQDPLQGRPSRSNEPAPLFSNATDDHLSVLTDSDEEPQPPKAKFKKGHTRKAVESALPSPAPKRTRKARITRKKK